jgi:hypothetical protein
LVVRLIADAGPIIVVFYVWDPASTDTPHCYDVVAAVFVAGAGPGQYHKDMSEKFSGPAWSMGSRPQPSDTAASAYSPGPGDYTNDAVMGTGDASGPAFTMGGRWRDQDSREYSASPGPGKSYCTSPTYYTSPRLVHIPLVVAIHLITTSMDMAPTLYSLLWVLVSAIGAAVPCMLQHNCQQVTRTA